jgi:hypothetical protein
MVKTKTRGVWPTPKESNEAVLQISIKLLHVLFYFPFWGLESFRESIIRSKKKGKLGV